MSLFADPTARLRGVRGFFVAASFAALSACRPAPPAAPATPVVEAKVPEKAAEMPSSGPAERAFEVHVVDVGTGLAVLVHGADFTLVYDGGSNDDLALGEKNRLLAYLRAVFPATTRIDHVVLSHPHRDHVELLADLFPSKNAGGYAIGDVWDGGDVHPICGYRRFLEAVATTPGVRYHAALRGAGSHTLDFAERAGAQARDLCGATGASPKRAADPTKPGPRTALPATVTIVHDAPPVEGAEIRLGVDATMTFLYLPTKGHPNDLNASSLVATLNLGGVKVLLSGDAEAGDRAAPKARATPTSIEGYLLANRRAALASDVWIVGHHGSKSSSRTAFIGAVSPRYAVISAGPTRYGAVVLPDAEVVAAIEAVAPVFRTDRHDDTCPTRVAKIGPDADGQAGGCDNVRIGIVGKKIAIEYLEKGD